MSNNHQSGFTLAEIMVVVALMGIIATMFFGFFTSSFQNYLKLQSDAGAAASVAAQSQRVASVVRGTTNISLATGNELVIYSYFYPSDAYVSLVRYYLSSDKKTLYCDVTPMTSNPPIGTPITTKKKTYTVAQNFALPQSGVVFSFLDASQDILAMPVADLNAIKMIQINLRTEDSSGTAQDTSLQISLRNRKTNL